MDKLTEDPFKQAFEGRKQKLNDGGLTLLNKSRANYFQVSEKDNNTMLKLTGDPFL